MDSPGGSLFLGGASVYVDNTAERLQEQEEDEDQQRREIELRQELDKRLNELDDSDEDSVIDSIIDDDDYNHSINNSSRFANANIRKSHRAPPGNLRDELCNDTLEKSTEDQAFGKYEVNQHINHYGSSLGGYEEYVNKKIPNEFVSDDQQLKMLYEVRVHEVQRLSEELSKCRLEATKTHDALYARLAIANSEKERAQISLQQSQELVANSKHHITELERKVASLSNKVETLQNQNDELSAEVSAATASLIDTQTRLQAEKFKNGNVQTDTLFRAQQERYKEDTERLEQDLLKTRNRLIEKENELLVFEKRFIDMERFKENLLVEKGSIINKLAVELEEAHNRIPNNDLIEKISRLTTEKHNGKYQMKELAKKLETTANELVETRSKLSNAQKEIAVMESTISEMLSEKHSDSFSILRNSRTGNEFSSQTDKINLLRNEFSKTVKILQLRKEEITKLKSSLEIMEEQAKCSKINEERLNEELELRKEAEKKLLSEIKMLTEKSQSTKPNVDHSLVEYLQTRCEDLEKQINSKTVEIASAKYSDSSENVEKLSHQLDDANTQLKDYKDLYFEVCAAKDKLEKELEEIKSTDLCKSLEEERLNFKELLEQLKIEKLKVDDLGNQLLNIKIDNFRNDLDDLKKNSTQPNEINCEIDELKKSNEQLLEENLKLKILEEDKKNHFSKLINELEESRQLINQLNNEIEILGQRDQLISDLKEKGKQFGEFIEKSSKKIDVRDAATSPRSFEVQNSSFTTNVNLEMERQAMEKKIRQENSQLFNKELKLVENELNRKFNDSEKQFSAKLTQLSDILKMKTEEVESLKEVILSERKKFQETPVAPSRDDEALHECKSQILSYQNSVKELSIEIERLRSASKFDSELHAKFSETLKAMEKLKDKYKMVKKTAMKYKQYIVEKDKHYKSEIIRVENAYKEALSNLNERLDSYIDQKEQELKLKSSNSKQSKGKSIKKNEPPND